MTDRTLIATAVLAGAGTAAVTVTVALERERRRERVLFEQLHRNDEQLAEVLRKLVRQLSGRRKMTPPVEPWSWEEASR